MAEQHRKGACFLAPMDYFLTLHWLPPDFLTIEEKGRGERKREKQSFPCLGHFCLGILCVLWLKLNLVYNLISLLLHLSPR